MTIIDYQQSSFNAGELSPLVKGREGLEKYKSGLKTCENALVLAHGPVTSRGGFRYIGEVKDSSKEVRLVPFEFNEDQAYVLELGDEYMRVWMDGGQVVTPDSDTDLLLHMDGADGDITFTDKSPNAHTITVNGNAQVDSTDPVYTSGTQPGNLLLDGAGDYLSAADHVSWNYAAGRLTLDLWFYVDDNTGSQVLYYQGDAASTADHVAMWVDIDTDTIHMSSVNADAIVGSTYWTYSAGFVKDTWYHLAIIRGWGADTDEWMACVNGVACAVSSTTLAITLPDHDQVLSIGYAPATFIPDVTSRHVMKANGNAVVSLTQNYFGSGSVYLDGSGDYLQEADHADWDILDQTDFTISMWVRHTDHDGTETYMGQYEGATEHWYLRHVHGSGIIFYARNAAGVVVTTVIAGEITDTDWHHLALCKVGNDYGVYVDGVLVGSVTDADTDTWTGPLTVGAMNATNDFSGYMDDIVLSYSDIFSVTPSNPVVDSGNTGHTVTSIAFCQGSAGAQKWGGSSLYFDGTTQNLTVPDHADWDVGTNYVWDTYIKFGDHVGQENIFEMGSNGGDSVTLIHAHGSGFYVYIYETGSGLVVNTSASAGGEITDTDWHHLTLIKVGSDWGVYVDGTQVQYFSYATAITPGATFYIGMRAPINFGRFFGYMDDFRVYNGDPFSAAPVVGLTDTITVPAAAHTSDANTKLLLHGGLALTVPTAKHVVDSDTKLCVRGDFMDVDGGIDEYRLSSVARWTAAFTVNTLEYPAAGGSAIYELATPWAESSIYGESSEVMNLKWAGAGDILYVCHPDNQVYKISRTDHDVWTCTIVDWDGPPWKAINDTAITLDPSATTGVGIDIVASAAFFSSNHVGAYFKQENGFYIITAVTDSTNAVATVKSDLDDHGATADWYLSAWNSVDGYPSAITFFEDRLCLSGAGGEPTTVRFSETGDYENMTVDTADSDPMSYQLLSQKYNKVLWIVGGKKLFIGTSGAEFWMSGAGANTPITPTSVLARRESTIGSKDIQPVTIGSSLMFIQRAGRTVNLWKYEYINDSFEATDLGVLAEHLFKDYSIIDTQYAQNPDHIIWTLRSDGILLGLTYMQDHEVAGWHKHVTVDSTGNGVMESFAVIPGTSQSVAMDELWVLVNRTIDGSTVRYIEMLTPKFGNFTLPYAANIDSCITYDDTPATVFSGADHLEGEAVNIIADGDVFNTTIASGGFTLASAASVVTVGLAYTVTIEFMVAILTELLQGVTTAKRKRIVELLIMMYETCQLNYGVDASNLLDAWNTSQLTDATLNDEYIKVEVNGNPEYEPTLMLTQDNPYPFTLLGIVETIEVED